jgi:hypothetical protein
MNSAPGNDSLSTMQRRMWLAQALLPLRGMCMVAGLELPVRIRVTTGPTIVSDGRPALGQCSSSASNPDGLPRITINDALSEPVKVLTTLLHELIHAADDCQSGHGAWFESWARKLGLVGTPITVPTPSLLIQLRGFAEHLGPYPPRDEGFIALGSAGIVA